MLEFYQAYADYTDLMELTEALFVELASAAAARCRCVWGEHALDSRRRGAACRSSTASRRRSAWP
jgi:lysyl-tRNA synthetase class II